MKSKVDSRSKNEITVFRNPDPLLKNLESSSIIRLRVLGQILPLKFLFSSVGLSILLFMIPMGIMFLSVFYHENTGLLLPILISSSLFFCFYSLVLGFLLLNTRIPFLNEWKEKLGFEEV